MSLCRIVKLDLVIISGHTARKLKTRNGCCRDCQRVNRLMIVIILLMKVLPTGILYGAHGHMRIKLSIPLAVMKGDIWYHLFPGGMELLKLRLACNHCRRPSSLLLSAYCGSSNAFHGEEAKSLAGVDNVLSCCA